MSEFTWGDAAATVSALSALLLLLSTIVIYWRTSRGKAVVAWNLREPGSPVIDLYVKNIGETPMYGLKVHVPHLARIMREGAVEGETQEPPCGTNVVLTTF